MEPTEQTFDFTKETLKENFTKWIVAFAKIPLQHYWGASWQQTTKLIGTMPGFIWESNEHVVDSAFFVENDFGIEVDNIYMDFPNEGYTKDGRELFVLKVEPHELYDNEFGVEILFTFFKNNTADVSYIGESRNPWGERYEKYAVRMEIPSSDITITWQEAYDLLCKIAKDEQKSVPECNV